MLNILGFIFLALIFFVLLGVMIFASAILSFIRKIKDMIGYDSASDHSSRDYTGRRRQQYAYRDNTANTANSQQQRQQSSSYTQDETIVDTRLQNRSSKKIFDDNEGEYVDFVEE